MTRTNGEYSDDDKLINGYDYDRQVWVKDGKYLHCGHPEEMGCKCYDKEHEGEAVSRQRGEQ